MIRNTATLVRPFIRAFNFLSPFGDLLARVWVAQIFFLSGLVKIQSWQTTLMLFEHVYHVPLLSPYFAAVLGTGAELILPVLLVLGLGGRFLILLFFIYNLVAAVSYHFLWTPEGSMGLAQHVNWALLLMLLMFHGSGKISLDYLIHKIHGHHLNPEIASKKKKKK
ncbi:MAG: DoxX family protein [Gammaproteobacteria bacterium]|nr:DoxX family protein [Gammaproteobacteria bacterium]